MSDSFYKLFMGDIFYPYGGYEDFKGNFDSFKSAKEHIEKNVYTTPFFDEKLKVYYGDDLKWAHIVLNDIILIKGKLDFDFNPKWVWEEVVNGIG